MSNSEQLYFRDLNRHEQIPPEEERIILQKVKDGDKRALNRLISGNLRFVVSIARRYRGRGLTLLELINEGNMGLHKAAKRFDMSKDVKFISYAVWWIRQMIQKAIFEQVGAMRIPLNKLALINKFKKALAQNDGDFDLTIEQEEFVGSRHDIIEIMNKTVDVSLDAPIGNNGDMGGGEASLMDVIGNDGEQVRESELKELSRVIDGVLNEMSGSEEKVLRMYYGINYSREFTLDEIGKELKLTRERVRQIKNKALKKLLRSKESQKKLSPYSQGEGSVSDS